MQMPPKESVQPRLNLDPALENSSEPNQLTSVPSGSSRGHASQSVLPLSPGTGRGTAEVDGEVVITRVGDDRSSRLLIEPAVWSDRVSSMSLPEFYSKGCRFAWEGSETTTQCVSKYRRTFIYRGNLGISLQAVVDSYHVTEEHGFNDQVAVKKIRLDNDEKRDIANNELVLLEGLNHNHIIKLLGSYTDYEETGILLFPAAQERLSDLIYKISDYNETRNSLTPEHPDVQVLRSFFTCSCQALIYLDQNSVRHRDVTPNNFLYDRSKNLVLADFGISKKYARRDAVTHGSTRFTTQYAPREASKGGRGPKYDVFSLGCVFLEVATVIIGETIDNLYSSLATHIDDRVVVYCDCYSQVKQWIDTLKVKLRENIEALGSPVEDELDENSLDIIFKMIHDEQNDRPSLETVWKTFAPLTKRCEYCHPGVVPYVQQVHTSQSGPIVTVTDTGQSNLAYHETALPSNSVNMPTGSDIAGRDFGVPASGVDGRLRPDMTTGCPPPIQPTSSAAYSEIRGGFPEQPGNLSSSEPGMEMIEVEESNETVQSNAFLPATSPKIRVYKRGRIPAWTQHLRRNELPGTELIVYEDGVCHVRPIHDETLDLYTGVLMYMPPVTVRNWRSLQGDLDLWRMLSKEVNWKRANRTIRLMFFPGNILDAEILDWTNAPGSSES